jgi:hypothetical protein
VTSTYTTTLLDKRGLTTPYTCGGLILSYT